MVARLSFEIEFRVIVYGLCELLWINIIISNLKSHGAWAISVLEG